MPVLRTRKPLKKGKHMRSGSGWTLVNRKSGQAFTGTLVSTMNIGTARLAIFSVPKRKVLD